MSNSWRIALGLTAVVALAGCGGGGGENDNGGDGDAGDTGEVVPDVPPDRPDVRPDVEPDVESDVEPDVPGDTPLEIPDIGREGEGGRDGDGMGDRGDRGDIPTEGTDPDGGGCDPTMCSINCVLSGYGSGSCVGDTCECSGSGDGGTTDGGPPDVPPTDGDLLDFIPGDGRDFGIDVGSPETTLDTGGTCDRMACLTACRDAGYTFGYCDASGACVCY